MVDVHAAATGPPRADFGPSVPMPLGARTKTLAGQSPRQWHPNPPLCDRRTSRVGLASKATAGPPPAATDVTKPSVSLICIVYRALLCLSTICLIRRTAFSEAPAATERPALPTITPSPIQDDANLHDVQFLDGRLGWAVGDHGVIWRTEDGGRDWRLLRTPADCPLRSVCFLSERVGWIVGGATMPFTRLGVGIVLATTDGGRTWTDLGRGRLPQLHSVRFFSLSEGVLVGEATAEFPTGVIVTHDGGKTWLAVEGAPALRLARGRFSAAGCRRRRGTRRHDGARIDGGKLVDVRAGALVRGACLG